MPYQPNPFVNPNQRGVELPVGCKDLMDALKKEAQHENGAGVSSTRPMERGRLSEIPKRIATLCHSKAFLKGLTVSHPRWNFVVQAVARSTGDFLVSAATDPERSGLKARLQANFPAVIQNLHGKEFVTVLMKLASEEEAADSAMDLLRRGCGVTEQDELFFITTEKEE